MIKKTIVLIVICFAMQSFAQNSLNDYKYVIVPNKYEFLKIADQYQLNSLSEFLFNKYSFKAYLEDKELPEDLITNRCLALKANVLEKKSMFKTKLKVELKNCNGQVVYTTPEGESRQKVYKVAYNEALRNAFNNFATISYNYNDKKVSNGKSETDDNDKSEIKKLKEEIKNLKAIKDNKLDKKQSEGKTAAVSKKENVKVESTKQDDILFAKLIPGSVFSYELKNNKNKTLHTILYYGKQDVYIVKGEESLVYKINNNWVIAEYIEGNLKVRAINIKF